MSIQANIQILNANDPEFIKAKSGTDEEIEEWEDLNGTITDRPGAELDDQNNGWLEETGDEHGGWVIDLANLPPNATHIVISRG